MAKSLLLVLFRTDCDVLERVKRMEPASPVVFLVEWAYLFVGLLLLKDDGVSRHFDLVGIELAKDLEDIHEVSGTFRQEYLETDAVFFLEHEVVSLREEEALILLIDLEQVYAEKVQLLERVEIVILEHELVDPLLDLLDVGEGPEAIVNAVVL